MNEPKRRGRPPKAKPEPKVEGACAECGQAVGHYDDCGVGMGVAAPTPQEQIGAMKAEIVNIWAAERAQAYALRVWNGQSPDVPRNERIRRVKLALEGQNLPFEGVELP